LIDLKENETQFHRETAKKCFNEAWEYLEKNTRDANDEQQMLHLAHTARYHWSLVESDKTELVRHLAISDWQISRVYAGLNEPQLALHFAKSALRIMEENNMQDILHTGYEGMVRAFAVGKDNVSATDYIKKAREQLGRTVDIDDEDRRIYSEQIHETESLIGQ